MTNDKKLYAKVSESNEIVIVDNNKELLKKNADDGNRVVMLHEVSLEDEDSDLAEAYAEKDSEGNILAIWNDKSYVDDDLLAGSHTILLQEV